MPRARWIVLGALLAVSAAGWLLNERGPFEAHPPLAYDSFLADARAGSVERVVRWRDRLEVSEAGRLLAVTIPAGRDLAADLAAAGPLGPRSSGSIPDQWIGLYTPWVPALLLAAGALTWGSALLRNRRAAASARTCRPVTRDPAGSS